MPQVIQRGRGSIPALAGEPPGSPGGYRLCILEGLSPRWRGNRVGCTHLEERTMVVGLSPRWRGNRGHGKIHRARKTVASVYPRVGGGTRRSKFTIETAAANWWVYPRVGGGTLR